MNQPNCLFTEGWIATFQSSQSSGQHPYVQVCSREEVSFQIYLYNSINFRIGPKSFKVIKAKETIIEFIHGGKYENIFFSLF